MKVWTDKRKIISVDGDPNQLFQATQSSWNAFTGTSISCLNHHPQQQAPGTNQPRPSCTALQVVGCSVSHGGNRLWTALQCLDWRAVGWGANPNRECWTQWNGQPTPVHCCHTSCCPHSSVTCTKLNTLTLVRATYVSHKEGVKTMCRKVMAEVK